MSATYHAHEDIAVIELDNPPVNGLGAATRHDVVAALNRAWEDEHVRAIVLMGAGKAFSGGADIREFNTPKALQTPLLPDVIKAVEDSAKPVVAALHGVAMGGGLELALACHYRIALPTTMLALPEVRLGLMPGAGGTQRLPRAIGFATALEMILSGEGKPAADLADTALIDELVAGDLRAAALDFARRLADQGEPGRWPRLRDRELNDAGADQLLEAARRQLAQSGSRLPAPSMCLDALAAALREPFDHGLKRERQLFLELLDTPESRALRHAFVSERAAAKFDASGAQAKPLKVIGVVGEEGRGLDLARALALAGYVVLWMDRGNAVVDAPDLPESVTFKPVHRLAEFADADLVIASSPPGMDADMPLFEDLDEVLKEGAILAADTATTNIDAIGAVTTRPRLVVALHGNRTASGIGLLEIGHGDDTAPEVMLTLLALARQLRIPVVICRGRNGLIGERLRRSYWRRVEALQEEGIGLGRITRALGAFGLNDTVVDADGAEPDSDDAGKTKVAETDVSDESIMERLMCSLVNEAAHILHEGVAQRASDIDLVCLKGHGFPVHTGGPLCFAHEQGLDCMVAALIRHGENANGAHPDWVPAPLLVRLANEGRRFD